MTVFSGMAALLCLLVGLQLFVLEAQIGQADANDHPDSGLQFGQWKAQAHTGAVMSLGAGVLIFLFALRHHSTAARAGISPSGQRDYHQPTLDSDSLSIRVFESDTADHFVEISPETEDPEWTEPAAPLPLPTCPTPPATSDLEPDVEPEGDPTDSIVQSIREALASENDGDSFPPASSSRLSFFGRLFRFPRRR